jgi:outer membrane protein TolC
MRTLSRKTKVTFLILALAILLWALTAEAEEIPLTLEEAIGIALRDNRDLLIKAEDVKKAKAKVNEAWSGLLPGLNFTGGWTYNRGYYNKDISQYNTQTTLKQYLYKGGKTVNSIAQNKYKTEVSGAILDKTKLELVLNVVKSFYSYLLARDFREVNRGILDNTRQHLRALEERYQNGQASESEIFKIKESLASVEEAYELSANQAESSLVLLKNLLYLDDKLQVQPRGDFVYQPQEISYDEAFLEAMQKRPEIRQYESQIKADRRGIEVAKAEGRPNIYASWDYYSRSHSIVGTVSEKNWYDYNIIGLTFSWPLFDGWATRAKVEQAIVDLRTSQLNKEKAIRDVALDLKNAYISLKDAIAKIKTTESDILVYQDNLSGAKEKCQQGIASFLDLDDANLRYNISQFNRRQAIYDYIVAKANFEKATGGL